MKQRKIIKDGKLTWEPVEETEAEAAQRKRESKKSMATVARATRNELLRGTDWTQLADAPLTPAKRKAYAAYRKALRDVTKQPDFPERIDWPDGPGAKKISRR
jgi:hypothetical protein